VPPSDHPPELDPAFSEAVHRTYVRPVDEHTAARHVAAMAQAAREIEAPAHAGALAGRPRRRTRAWRPALATGLAVLGLPAGLAVAGVDLPDPVDAPYSVVGIDLPNQDERRAPATPASDTPSRLPAATQPSTPAAPSQGRRADDERRDRERARDREERTDRDRGGRERPSDRGEERGVRARGEGAGRDGSAAPKPPKPTLRQERSRPGKPAGTPAAPRPRTRPRASTPTQRHPLGRRRQPGRPRPTPPRARPSRQPTKPAKPVAPPAGRARARSGPAPDGTAVEPAPLGG
jgi:hypothetical protein